MKDAHNLVVGLVFFCVMQACTERMICPAYQSAFIHDKQALNRHFSYFKEDSTPKILSASKDRYNIIEPVAYRKKLRSLRTVPMTDIYPQEDSLSYDDQIELIGYDSTAVIREDTLAAFDSVYVISLKKEHFNIDQELYLWYLKDFLIYPDVRIQMEGEMEKQEEAEKEKKKGFFKGLFKKKNKSDSTAIETSATELDDEPVKEKRKPFGLFKKRKQGEESDEDSDNNDEGIPSEDEEDDDF